MIGQHAIPHGQCVDVAAHATANTEGQPSSFNYESVVYITSGVKANGKAPKRNKSCDNCLSGHRKCDGGGIKRCRYHKSECCAKSESVSPC